MRRDHGALHSPSRTPGAGGLPAVAGTAGWALALWTDRQAQKAWSERLAPRVVRRRLGPGDARGAGSVVGAWLDLRRRGGRPPRS